MDTKDIRCFEIVYEEQSINKAAKQLFISPQGLSKIIQNLENELNTQLFIRSQKGVLPTKTGDYFYSQCKGLLHKLEQIKLSIQKINEETACLYLGFAIGSINIFPPSQLVSFMKEKPGIAINWAEMPTIKVIEDILNNSLDIGFTIGSTIHPELYAEDLFTCNVNVIVPEGHPFFNKGSVSILDLKDQPLISLGEHASIYHNIIRRCNDFGFTPDIIIKTMESQLIYRFCSEGIGLGIDVNIHKNDPLLENLHRIPITDAIPWKISMIIRQDRLDEPMIQQFCEYFKHFKQ